MSTSDGAAPEPRTGRGSLLTAPRGLGHFLGRTTVGAVALPLMILLALAKVRALEGSRRRDDDR